jgi:hypothetical protein
VSVRQAGTQRFAHLFSLEGAEPREGVPETFGAGRSVVSLRRCRQGRRSMLRFAFCGEHIVQPRDRVVRALSFFHSWLFDGGQTLVAVTSVAAVAGRNLPRGGDVWLSWSDTTSVV